MDASVNERRFELVRVLVCTVITSAPSFAARDCHGE
jgi:hypothetical protein